MNPFQDNELFNLENIDKSHTFVHKNGRANQNHEVDLYAYIIWYATRAASYEYPQLHSDSQHKV